LIILYDIIIIGAGIVGCAAARELSRYKLRILVLERGADVAVGASKANSGIVHAGYDCYPGTQKARLNVQGAEIYKTLVKELDIPYRNNGSLVLCFAENEMPRLRRLYENGITNGVTGLSLLTGEEALRLEPNLSPYVYAALLAETAAVISPYEAAIAFAENAAENGAEFLLETEVTGIRRGECFEAATSRGNFQSRIVINAAGVDSGQVHHMLSGSGSIPSFLRGTGLPEAMDEGGDIRPQRGQYYLLDNTQRDLVTRTIFQLPTHLGKGVLVAPTVDYNILLGPTAENVENTAESTHTTREGLDETLEKVRLSLADLPARDRITAFAGVRAKHPSKDFVITESQPGFIEAVGIDSPGLSAAPAIALNIAERVLHSLDARHITVEEHLGFQPRRTGIKRFKPLSFEEQAALIRENPAYGNIVCRCETVTEAEIVAAIRRPVGARNLDAVKRRTRAQMGRCQGGFCTLKLTEILARELGTDETKVTKDGEGSALLRSY
jgi:glycerol-3-phosphate dehydrogenase